MRVGPTALRGRRQNTTYLYDDEKHPDRVTSTVGEPWFTTDDRALLLGLKAYEDTLCPGGCGQPKELAWHSHGQLSWESDEVVCHACTARKGEQVTFSRLSTTLTAEDIRRFPAFEWGETTTRPDPPKS
jgi:hypothetical protein